MDFRPIAAPPSATAVQGARGVPAVVSGCGELFGSATEPGMTGSAGFASIAGGDSGAWPPASETGSRDSTGVGGDTGCVCGCSRLAIRLAAPLALLVLISDERIAAAGGTRCALVLITGGGTKGSASTVVSTSFTPANPIDITNTRITMAAAMLREQSGVINGCAETILLIRARRPEEVSTAGAPWRVDRDRRVASFTRHSAYVFGEPVIATVVSSQAISRSTCTRRSIHQTAGCHPAIMRTMIWAMLTMSSRRCTCAHS